MKKTERVDCSGEEQKIELDQKHSRAETISRCTSDEPPILSHEEQPRVTAYAAWCGVLVAMAGLWQYGFSIGSINAGFIAITSDIEALYEQRRGQNVTSSFVNAIWVASSTAFPVGGMFGSLLTAPIVRRFGRLKGILYGQLFTILFTIFMTLTTTLRSPELLIVGRFGIGGATGTATGICAMYLIEVSPQHARGVFGAMLSWWINIGLFGGNALGLPQIMGNEDFWPLLLAITAVPSVFFLLLVWTLPESPRKLYLEDGNVEKATRVLRRLNGMQNVNHILEDLKKEKEEMSSSRQLTAIQLLRSNSLRSSLIAAAVLATSQQITGLNSVSMYMNTIFVQAGVEPDTVFYFSVGVAGMSAVITGIVMPLTEKMGRKVLLKVGYGIEGISLIILAISMELQHLSNAMGYISVVASIGFRFGFSVGPGPITILAVAEFFKQSSRPAAMMICTALLWFGMALTTFSTPYMLASIRGYTFLLFGIIALLTMMFVIIKVPETKNRQFSVISNSFEKKRPAGTEVVK